MYTLKKTMITQEISFVEKNDGSGVIVVFGINPEVSEYQQFVRDIKSDAQLNDAEGNQMTPEQITTFLETLP